eukprot:14283369-Ditylum_brightwellii.AAC.1
MCICLQEAKLQKPLKKRIACALKEHEESDDKKPIKPHHKKREGQTKHYGRRICVIKANSMGADEGK